MALTDIERSVLNKQLQDKLPREVYRAKEQVHEKEEELPSITPKDLLNLLDSLLEEGNFLVDELLKSEIEDPNILGFLSGIKGQLLANLKAIALINEGRFEELTSPEIEEDMMLEDGRIEPQMMPGESRLDQPPKGIRSSVIR